MIPKTIRPMPLSSGSIYAENMIAAYYGHPAAETQTRTAVRTNPTGPDLLVRRVGSSGGPSQKGTKLGFITPRWMSEFRPPATRTTTIATETKSKKSLIHAREVICSKE